MIYSMTGYAALTDELALGTLSIEIRSVNHRYLDIQFRLPDELRVLEPGMRELVAARLTRGKVECRVGLQTTVSTQVSLELNQALLRQLKTLDQRVRSELPGAASLTVSDVVRWPGMVESAAMPPEQLRERSQALMSRTLEEFTASRAREGEKLKAVLLERVVRIEALVQKVQPRIPLLITAYQERLSARLKEALKDVAVPVDEDRLRQELVLYASKVDVEEELSRLVTHLAETRRVLASGGAAGKRLDFLMQELNREANTLGSKSVDADVSQASVELKVLIEQMREQVQNIE
ncbi:MAG TPA: YicC/YloC family endoribonuclease [Burkholderiales bacterium]|nr:YicC/YloC family endoribonuclease [Burkholderiales bacterium]